MGDFLQVRDKQNCPELGNNTMMIEAVTPRRRGVQKWRKKRGERCCGPIYSHQAGEGSELSRILRPGYKKKKILPIFSKQHDHNKQSTEQRQPLQATELDYCNYRLENTT